MYIDETWHDNEWDEEGAHSRRLIYSWMNTLSTLSNKRKGHIHEHHQARPIPSKAPHTLPCGGEDML